MGNELGRADRASFTPQAPALPGTPGWSANIELRFAHDDGATRLSHCAHHGPLRVQRAFFPEGPSLPHVYLLHPPGGLVPGDRLSIAVRTEPDAHALVTTPSAGKCYRSDGRVARQEHALRVDERASLEWFPHENIVFDGANVELETSVDVAPDAVFVGWNLLCFGRPASRAPFERGVCKERFTLTRAGEPLFVERATYNGHARLRRGAWGLSGRVALGTMLAYPARAPMLECAREVEQQSRELGEGALFGSTLLASGVLCCRYLGDDVGRAREHFAKVWSALRPALLGRTAVPPRIWAT